MTLNIYIKIWPRVGYKTSIKVGEDLLVSNTEIFTVSINWSIPNAVNREKVASRF